MHNSFFYVGTNGRLGYAGVFIDNALVVAFENQLPNIPSTMPFPSHVSPAPFIVRGDLFLLKPYLLSILFQKSHIELA